MSPNNDLTTSSKSSEQKSSASSANEITISAVGDIIVHDDQLKGQYSEENKNYDFTNNFKFIKPYIEGADIAVGNLETTFAGQAAGYRGYPTFNCPDALADALKDSGFDILSTANNHCMDSGAKGVLRTLEVLKNKGLSSIGIKPEKSEADFIIRDVKGIKLGFTSYTFETPSSSSGKTINSIHVPKDVEGLISSFNPSKLNEELPKMKKRIDDMKKNGAQVIIVSVHWGDEYQLKPNSYQKTLAKALNEYGVDIILGSHPHVIQPVEFITSPVSGKETFVIYSLGNFLSNQRFERTDNRYTEDGVVLNIKLNKSSDGMKINIADVSFMPTWVYRYTAKDKFVYEILPIFDALANKNSYNLINKDDIWRAENSEKNTLGILEDSNSKMVHAPVINSSPNQN